MSFQTSRPGIKVRLLPRYPVSVSATVPIVAATTGGALALSYDASALADGAPVDPAAARVVYREAGVYKEATVTDILGAAPAMAAMTVKANVQNTTAAVADVALANFAKPIGLNISRDDISSVYIPVSAIVVQGYSVIGDEGAGAIYVIGTSGGLNAIQDAGGNWWNLYVKGRPINPGWFGALKDGVSDDSAAILAAANAANGQGGGTVQLESGTYFVNTAITHPSYVEIAGRGRSTIVKLGTGIALTSQWLANTNTTVTVANTRVDTQMVVRDIFFDCSARPYPKYLYNPATGLDVAGATDPIRNAPVVAPMTTTSGSNSATVTNAAWQLWQGMTVSHANVPAGTTISNVAGTTITLSANATANGAANGTFTPASAYSVTGYVMRYINCTDVLVTGCYFADHGSTCVLMQGCFDSGTRDNFIFRCGRVDFSSNAFLMIHTGTARAIVGATQGATTVLTLNAAHTFSAPVTPTIDTVSGSAACTVSSATSISAGMEIVSANVPAGTTVASINGTTVTMSAAATATAAGTASTFYTRVMVYGLGGLGNAVTDGLYRVTATTSTTLTIDVNTAARNDFILDGRGIVGSYFLTLADRCFSENDRAFACNRAMIQMGPSRGGRIVSPSMRQMKEAGIYLAYAQDTQISNPVILDVTRSDLVASGIEQNYCAETTIIGGSIRNTDGPSLNGVGIIGNKVNGTSLENPVYTTSQTYPFGPFNEGVGFGGGFNLGQITTTAASTSATVAAAASPTINTTNASTTVTPTSMVGLEVGQSINSANVPAGAYITAVGTSTITISSAATATAGPTAASFYPLNVVSASTTTVTTVSGSTRVTPTAMTNLRVGQVVTSANIPAGAIVTKIETSTVVLSAAATGTAGPTACTWTECRRLVSSGLTAGTIAIAFNTATATATLSQAAASSTTGVGCRFSPYDSGGAPIQMDQRSAVLLNASAGYSCLNDRFDGVEVVDSRGNASGVFYMTRSGGSAAGSINRLGVTAIDTSRFQRRGGITTITNANPAAVTTDGDHGLQNNATVYIRQVAGMTAINGGPYVVTRTGATTFTIPVDSSAMGAYVAGVDFWGQTDNGFDFQDANTALGSYYVTTRLYY